jgi:predicted MFS family arabinose efflux permease
MRDALKPLELPGFRQLAFAYTVNELGNWLGEIALAVLVFEQTGSPMATAALFLGMQFLPALAAQGLVARIEISGTRVGLPAIYAAEALTFVAIAVIADDFVLGAIIALAALDGSLALTGRAFTRAAAAAVLTPSGQLREGNALLNIGFTAAGALGPAAAGVVVAGLGVRTALLADAASFLVVALILAMARSLPSLKAREPEPWRERLRHGLDYVRERPLLRRLLGAQAAAFVFFAAVIPIEIVYATDTLDAGSSGYGALLAAWGAGMVLGSLVFAGARRVSLQALLFFSTILVGGSYLALSAAGTIYVACAMSAAGGLGNGVQWVSVMSAVQELTEERFQARVVGLLESSGYAMPGIGFVIGGIVAEALDPRASFFIAGAGVIAVVLIAAPLLRGFSWRSAGDVEVAPVAVIESPASHLVTRP